MDDETGFTAIHDLDLNALLASRHYGLAAMLERASIIKGRVWLETRQGGGTRVHLTWPQEG